MGTLASIMENNLNSDEYEISKSNPSLRSTGVFLEFLAVASMVVGGLAVACWYRKTLFRLRESGEIS
jgi:hypothetical protein